jgi:methylthioribose-1-phosphate isomerase
MRKALGHYSCKSLEMSLTRTRSVFWDDSDATIGMIDQRILPTTLELVKVATVADTVRVIKDMTVRGAPAIGAAGGFGMALAANASAATTVYASSEVFL